MNEIVTRSALPARFAAQATQSLLAIVAAAALLAVAAPAWALEVVSDQTVTGFKFPESVGCDANARVLYVSEFGSELKPTQKDGAGRISKVSLTGQVLEQQVFPTAGQVLNKPKGIWILGTRLWVTDIDSVWEFDTKTKKGRKVELPGIQFANDPSVSAGVLYVTDNRGDALYSVTPADFLEHQGEPTVKQEWSGKGVNPNGIYPAKDGSLLLVGFKSNTEARGIFSWRAAKEPKDPVALSQPIGRMDGVQELSSGDLLVTDWNSGSLMLWSPSGSKTLAKDFKGPADLCSMADGATRLVAVPDLVKSELRLVRVQ